MAWQFKSLQHTARAREVEGQALLMRTVLSVDGSRFFFYSERVFFFRLCSIPDEALEPCRLFKFCFTLEFFYTLQGREPEGFSLLKPQISQPVLLSVDIKQGSWL
jgi:hypothetical protein